MEIPILFEDERMLVINKPRGVMTHPDGVSTEETVSDWFAARYPESATVGETQRLKDGSEIMRPGIVHRLDRETSGVLVLAKTQEMHALYAPNRVCDLADRLALHAHTLTLPLPEGPQKFTAPVPADLTEAVARFPNTEYLLRRT